MKKIKEKLKPIFLAQREFFWGEKSPTSNGSHLRKQTDLKRLMILVVFALTPSLLFGIWNVGLQNGNDEFFAQFFCGLKYVLPIIIVSYAVGGFWEVLFAILRKKEISEGFLVTGLIFALILPPTIPLWTVAAGISFGIVIGKEIFGGTGMNFINPALLGRIFLFFAYPQLMSGNEVWSVNAITQATPLVTKNNELSSIFWGNIAGSIGETSTFAILLGGFFLLFLKLISWRIIISAIFGMWIFCFISDVEFLWNFCAGGFAFAIFFMATDPVTAPIGKISQIICGFLIGILTMLFRLHAPIYPEGAMLAIILINILTPFYDFCEEKFYIWRRKNAKLA